VTEERTEAATSAASSVAGTTGGLVERLLANEIVFGVVILGGRRGCSRRGALRAGVADRRAWGGAGGAVPGVAAVRRVRLPGVGRLDGARRGARAAGDRARFGETIAQETGVILVVGVIALGWRALSAWRAEANTPDNVTTFEVDAERSDDGGGN